MNRKNIITLSLAGAILLAGAGTAAGVTAHNYNVAKQAAEQEGLTAITVDYTQPAPSVGTGTTAPPVTDSHTTTQASTKGESSSKSTTAPKTTAAVQTTKISWTYDAELSERIAEQIVKKHPDLKYDSSLFQEKGPGNFVHEEVISTQDNPFLYINKIPKGNDTAEQIVNAWSQLGTDYGPTKDKRFCVVAYRYSNGYYFVAFC